MIEHLSSQMEYLGCEIVIEILFKKKDKVYKYKTSEFIERKFRQIYKFSKMKAFNYLKKNSELVNKKGLYLYNPK